MANSDEESPPEKPFHVDRAKTGRAGCKKCKQKIPAGELRLAKLGYNPFGSGTMKMWHHIHCLFEAFKKQRATTKKIEHCSDIGGWNDISKEDQEEIKSHLGYLTPDLLKNFEIPQISNLSSTDDKQIVVQKDGKSKTIADEKSKTNSDLNDHKDNSFREFRRLCVDLTNESSYTNKTNIIKKLFTEGSDGKGFKGDIEQWCRLLLPGVIKRVYNLQSKQLVKIFSNILNMDHREMLEDLHKGDVAETIGNFFEKNDKISPSHKAVLSLQEIDKFLEHLAKLTKEDDQINHFTKITKKSTVNDLKMIIRLVKHDLRINAGAKHVLEALHADAYEAFQTSRDITSVVKEALSLNMVNEKTKSSGKSMAKDLKLMTPVLPMLAQACKTVEMAMKKCPEGIFSEIKYDGERVQLHKQGNTFKYFSRSLKPVLPHKVDHFKDYIPQAFPHGKDLILDAEVLMVDTNNGQPLPFGSLGKHKKNEFKDASVCLFVFDCLYYNGESLINKTTTERKKVLQKNMIEVKNHIMFSEMLEVHTPTDLESMMTKVFKLGLEGLVLKGMNSKYEPGKRHWLKVKKDYLFGGAMADTADLVVLGAWFGTGNKGGIMSSFLMGCIDTQTNKWVTVTKVSGGHDENTLGKLQKELDVIQISKDPLKVPSWLKCTKTMIPDFIATDPKSMPVWEITGAEFTCNQVHTANGISVRFPRVTKIRSDKDWKSATNLQELVDLFERSKDTSTFSLNQNNSLKRKGLDENLVLSPKKKSFKKDGNSSDDETVTSNSIPDKSNSHSSDTETEVDDLELPTKFVLKNPLPDIFNNLVIELPKNLEDYDLLKRYIIAYGGKLYDSKKNLKVENSKLKVTHVIHIKDEYNFTGESIHWSKDVRHVVIKWLWDSIKLLEKQKETKYFVYIS